MKIITHSGAFHADELVATALLKIFKVVPKNVKIVRTRDSEIIQDAFLNNYFVIDVGGEYDGLTKFDHHHDSSLKSSAGLIWDFLKNEKGVNHENYPAISKLVDCVDKHDLGIKKAEDFEFSSLVSNYNGIPALSDKDFDSALEFVERMISTLKRYAEGLEKTKQIIDESEFLIKDSVLFLKEFTRQWDFFINGEKSDIKYVAWKDEAQNNYKIQVVSVEHGSFELAAPELVKDESMVFVHNNGFLAVAGTIDVLKTYIEKHL